MNKIRKFLLSLPILAGLIGLTACSNNPTVLRPTVYGVAAGAGGSCYYVQSPLEAQALIADGLCQPTWTPTLAPPAWEYAYASYLFAPNSFYMTHYVPVGNRVNYSSYSTTFVTTHRADIDRAKTDTSSPYKYTDSKGKTYTAAKAETVKKGTFGGGTRTGFGGGNRTGKSSSVFSSGSSSGTAQSNSKSSGSKSSSTFGGGSRSSSGSSSSKSGGRK